MSFSILLPSQLPELPHLTTDLSQNFVAWERILRQAQNKAHVPTSGFKVGAVAIGSSGKGYLGWNVELEGLPLAQTIHAEQFALCQARSAGESALQAFIVSEWPCGHCRQFLQELAQPDLPITVVKSQTLLTKTLAELLPFPFAWATTQQHILKPINSLKLSADMSDPLLEAAAYAAQSSYVPYTHQAGGIALQTHAGQIYTGCVLESAAYNPTLPALQNAVIELISANTHFLDVAAVAQVLPDKTAIPLAEALMNRVFPTASIMSAALKENI